MYNAIFRAVVVCFGVFAVSLAGCSYDNTESPDLVAPTPASGGVVIAYGNPSSLDKLDPQIKRERVIASVGVLAGLGGGIDFKNGVINSDMTFAQKLEASKDFLSSYPGEEWLQLRQLVAAPLLYQHYQRGDANVEALDYYASILAEAENPNTDIMVFALGNLGGVWSDAKIQQSARVTIDAAGKWIDSNCDNCSVSGMQNLASGKGTQQELSENESKAMSMRQALPSLQELAQ